MTYTENMTVAEARDQLREEAKKGGGCCPVCTQRAQVYRMKINSSMARALILMYRASEPDEYIHVPTVLRGIGARGNELKLKHWNMLRQAEGRTEDGNPRTGWWKLTETGRLFVDGAISVPSHADLFDGRCLGFSGKPWTIHDALGSDFSWSELMTPAVAS